jgi:hypothetical protein
VEHLRHGDRVQAVRRDEVVHQPPQRLRHP